MTRKIFLSAILILILVSSSHAKLQSFGNYRVDVPSGWKGELQGSSTLVVKSLSENASIAVAFNPMGEAAFTDIVERLYIQMNGTDLEQDEDGDYMFNFTNLAGAESVALVTCDDDQEYYLVISLTGMDNESIQDDMETIIDSLDYED